MFRFIIKKRKNILGCVVTFFVCFGYFIHFLTTSVQGDFILPSGGDLSRYALFARFYASGC